MVDRFHHEKTRVHALSVYNSMHDAFFYSAPADSWLVVDAAMDECMDEASQAVLGDGYVLKSDREVVFYPEHYSHDDGGKMWAKIEVALTESEAAPSGEVLFDAG